MAEPVTAPPNAPTVVALPERRAEWAYVLPMAAFMAFTWAGGQWKPLYPYSYVAKTVVVAGLLVFCWPYVARVRWTHLGTGFAVGLVGTVQWIGMEKLLMAGGRWTAWTRTIGDIRGEAFRPDHFFASTAAMVAFLAFRFLGPVLVVPVMEELFWRNWLWRTIASPNDYRLQAVGEYDRFGFWGTALMFAVVHPQWLTSIVWALGVGWLLLRTRSLAACIVAHATTNALLGVYVLVSWFAFGWDEWFFW